MDEKILQLKIRRNFTSFVERLTCSDVNAVQDRLFARNIVKDFMSDVNEKNVRERCMRILDIVFKAQACSVLLEILDECGFKSLVDAIEKTDVSQSEEGINRSKTYLLDHSARPRDIKSAAEKGETAMTSESDLLAMKDLFEAFSDMKFAVKEMSERQLELNEQLECLNTRSEKQLEDSAKHGKAVQDLSGQFEWLSKKVDTAEAKYDALQTEYSNVKGQLQEREAKINALVVENHDILQESEKIKEDIERLRSSEETLIKKLSDLEKEEDKLVQEKEMLKRQSATMDRDYSELKMNQDALNRKLDQIRTKEKGLKKERAELAEKEEKFKKVEAMESNITTLRSSLDDLSKKLRLNEYVLKGVRKDKLKLEQHLEKVITEKREVERLLKKERDDAHKVKNELNEIKSKQKSNNSNQVHHDNKKDFKRNSQNLQMYETKPQPSRKFRK